MTTLRPHLPIGKPSSSSLPANSSSTSESGPPNDDNLADAVRSSLGSTGYQQLRRIDVDVEDGHVKLSGRVARYYLLQIAQQAAMKTDGVASVGSEIEVARRRAD